MPIKINRPVFLSAVVVVAGVGLIAVAGELNPPAGAVSPTMKDLDDVEPRNVIRNNEDGVTPIVISSPGSYKLGENIHAIGGEHGIEITSGRVSIDLNGFEILGSEVGSLNGIFAENSVDDLTIRNGRIRFFTGAGISFVESDRCRIEDVDVISTAAGGIVCGESAFIENCTANTVTIAFAVGISVGEDSKVFNCSADNCYTGFLAQTGSQVTGCHATGSTFAGFYVFGTAVPSGCVAIGTSQQTQYGIYQEGFGLTSIAHNVITEFTTAGIRAEGSLQVHHNVINGSSFGGDTGMIFVGPRNFVFENSFLNCSVAAINFNNNCEQKVFANRLANTGLLAINNCSVLAPEQQAGVSTNPHANLR